MKPKVLLINVGILIFLSLTVKLFGWMALVCFFLGCMAGAAFTTYLVLKKNGPLEGVRLQVYHQYLGEAEDP